jgi:hypothetical protein
MTTILLFSLVFASYGKSKRITNCVGCRQYIHRERKKKRIGTRNHSKRIRKKRRERKIETFTSKRMRVHC